MTDKKNIEIELKEIKEITFNSKSLPETIGNVVLGENIQLGLQLSIGIDLEKNQFELGTRILFVLTETNQNILEFESAIIFNVKNLASAVKTSDIEGYNIDDNFLSTLAGISIGTNRGILYEKTKGTQLAKLHLPIINPKELIKQMKEVNKQ